MADARFPGILLFGAPGVGKGTQGAVMGRIPGFFHLSSGDVFRSIDKNSEEGREFERYAAHGELVPDDFTLRICLSFLDRQIGESRFRRESDILILDGLPRNVKQAALLEDHVDVLQVLHLVCADEAEMVRRIKGRALEQNRTDDADEGVIRHRFEVYRNESAPVLEHYERGLIAEVEALATPAEVLRNILDCVIPVQNAHFGMKSG